MAMLMIDGTMITNFVEDQAAFNNAVDKLFMCLDMDRDGVLSRVELLKGFEGLLTSAEPRSPTSPTTAAIENAVFESFDKDKSGNVDQESFRREMKQIMIAMARGIGDSPVQMMVDEASFLMRVIEHDRAKSDD